VERAATPSVLRRAAPFTVTARSVFSAPGKERRATTSGRLLPYRARCLATSSKLECGFDPANRASHTRSPRPRSSPHRRVSELLRGYVEPRTPFPPGLRPRFTTNAQVIDQRCVRPASANDTSTTGTHVSFGDLAVSLLAKRPPDAWRVSRRPTHFGCSRFRLCEAGVFFPRRRPSCDPLTLPSPRSAVTPLPGGPRRCLRARGQDHPPASIRDDRRKY
jgi:hypothetical protein